MKIAVIPPISLLPWSLSSTYQLMLPQLLYSGVYKTFFQYLCNDASQYVILDNGAAEGYHCTDKELVSLALEYRPDEIVIPDVIGDGPATFTRVQQFLKSTNNWKTVGVRKGVVAAGKDKHEAFSTVLALLHKFDEHIDVIYIPRSLVRPDDKDARIRLATMIRHVTEKEIHFLGASPYWIKEMQQVASLGIVRGMDTSAPFNYAFYDCWVGNGRMLARPNNYFNLSGSCFTEDRVVVNINTMKEWANGID